VLFDLAGNLYSTTSGGGRVECPTFCGTVFELQPSTSGSWTQTVLLSFNENDGYIPQNVIFDSTGNLYGTTVYGGDLTGCGSGYGCGLVFELTQ
jgi:hypothetical protein